MLGYYCDNNDCKPVPIRDMEPDGKKGKYMGVTVGRDKNCWGVCKYLILGTNDTFPYDTLGSNVSANYSRGILPWLFIGIFILIVCLLVYWLSVR